MRQNAKRHYTREVVQMPDIVDHIAEVLWCTQAKRSVDWEGFDEAAKELWRKDARATLKVVATELIRLRDHQKGRCCDNCRCAALADAISLFARHA